MPKMTYGPIHNLIKRLDADIRPEDRQAIHGIVQAHIKSQYLIDGHWIIDSFNRDHIGSYLMSRSIDFFIEHKRFPPETVLTRMDDELPLLSGPNPF